MAQLFKFFNSAPGDPRTYQAADFADYFGSVLSTGLLHTDNVPGMSVSVEAGTLNTVVSAGKAIMDGHLYENTTDLTLTHAIPEATLDRIDRVVLRLDLRNSERNILLHVKEGDASASPIAPTLQRDNFIYEISLAQILVRANTVQLLADDLVDERLDENLAGLVYSLISIPTSQFQAEWDAFMADIQESGFASVASVTAVSDDLATHMADDISHVKYGADIGTANAKVVTLNPIPTAYVEGMAIAFKNAVQNTGAVTININGLGAKPVLKSNGNALTSGNLKVNSVYTLRYNGTSFILQGEGGEYGTAIASDVLIGKTLGTENGIVEGTLVPGKRYLTGTATSSGSTSAFPTVAGSTNPKYSLNVTGLPFTPKDIAITRVQGSFVYKTIYKDSISEPYAKIAYLYPVMNTSAGSSAISALAFKADVAPSNVSNGFNLPVEVASTVFTWEAWE